METMEEEPRHFSDVDSSVHLEDAPVTTETVSEVQNQNTEPRSELESAPSAVTPVTEKEGVVDVEVAVGGEEGGEDLIVGEEKDGMLDSGVEMKDSPPVDGDKEGGDGEDSHVEGERAEFVEDATVDDVMDEMEDAGDVSDERLTAEGIEVPAARQQVVELAQEAGNSVEQKVTDDVNDNLDVPEDKDVADVAEERGTDDATEKNLVKEETSVAVEVTDSTEQSVIKEETGIMEEREVAGLSVKSELPVDNEVEQSGEIKDKTGVDNIAEKIEYLDKPVVDLAVPTEVAGETAIDMVEKVVTLEEKMVTTVSEHGNLEDLHAVGEVGTDMTESEENPVMERKIVNNVSEQTENLEDIHAVEEASMDMVEAEEYLLMEGKMVNNVSEQTENLEDMHAIEEAGADTVEAEEDPAMEEESDNEEDTCLGNVAEDVDKAEGTETEMTDTAEVMRAADYSELPDMTEELETEAAEEMEGMEEIEDTSKASVGKRKRGKNLSAKVQAKAPSRKKAEEDVCFICFDGGALVLCDRRGCPKAYHPACVGRDEAFFQTKGKWNCVKSAGVGFSEGKEVHCLVLIRTPLKFCMLLEWV